MPIIRPPKLVGVGVRLLAAAALVAALIPLVDTGLAPAPRALAANFVVNQATDPGDGTCDATCTLRDAILAANALAGHDTITFSSTVTTPIVLGSALPIIAQALTIDGSGQAITVDGANAFRPFFATAPLTLTALTVQRGRASDGFGGGGAYFGSNASLWGASFISNTVLGGQGGGAYVAGAAVVTGTAFLTNTTNLHGGGLYVASTSAITNSTFMSNTAVGNGGGAYLFGVAAVAGSTFARNRVAGIFSSSGGGAAFGAGGSLASSSFVSNTAVLYGGGVNAFGALAVSGSTFTGNSSGNGGGAYLGAGGGVTATTFVSNTALADGGGLYLGASAASLAPTNGDIAPITGATFTGNQAQGGSGGGAKVAGPAAISGSTFGGNSAAAAGGGVSAQASTVVSETESSYLTPQGKS